MRIKLSNTRGQSMFEVIFAIAIAALILVGVTSLAATSVRNSSFSKSNALATKYAQEAVEWLRQERDTNWSQFSARASGSTISLGTIGTWGGSCIISGTEFCRKVTLSGIATDTIEATVEVSWSDNQVSHESRNITRFTNWNK